MTCIIMSQINQEDEYAQVSLNEGIKRYGEKAVEAMKKEYAQLGEKDKDVFETQDPKKLTKEQKRKALRAINLIKKKRDTGKIKGRMAADGSRQRVYIWPT